MPTLGRRVGPRSGRRLRPRLACGALLAAALVASTACGDDDGGDPAGTGGAADSDTTTSMAPAPDPGPPYDVTEVEETYVDTTRPVDDPAGTESADERTLVTSVRVPDGSGPFPLVVFAHGFTGHPRKDTEILGAWAEAGYVVAAPAFPLTNDDVAEPLLTDFPQQPADVSAVIDGVLEDAASDAGPLAGRVDPERIAVVGHSLGGASMYGVLGNSCCRDERVDVGIGFAALKPGFDGEYATETDLPLLLLHGDADPVLPYDGSVGGLAQWPGPVWLITLLAGTHSAPFEDEPSDHDELVVEATLAFLDAHLGSGDPSDWGDYAPSPDLATLTPGPGPPG